MSDGGRQEKPGERAAEPKKTDLEGEPRATPAALPGWPEIQYRATGGTEGTPPLARITAGRQAVGSSVMQRLAIMRKVGAASEIRHNTEVPKTSGSPLPGDVRAKMEPRLGADLSGVKVHAGGESERAAEGFGARAFTVGSDVHFGAGQFAPGTKEGDKLIAHELTHVVQGQKSGVQRKADEAAPGGEKGEAKGGGDGGEKGEAKAGGEAAGMKVSSPDESAEKEADAVSEKVGDDLHSGGDKKEAKGDRKKDKSEKDGAEKGAQGASEKAEAGHGGAGSGHAEEKGEGAAAGKEKAPAIGAKLQEGVVFTAKAGGNNLAPHPEEARGFVVREGGKYMLAPNYRNYTFKRQKCYGTNYRTVVDKWLDEVVTAATDPKNSKMWKYKGKWYDKTTREGQPTIDHKSQPVNDHWNTKGNNCDHDARKDYYNGGGSHKTTLEVQPRTINCANNEGEYGDEVKIGFRAP